VHKIVSVKRQSILSPACLDPCYQPSSRLIRPLPRPFQFPGANRQEHETRRSILGRLCLLATSIGISKKERKKKKKKRKKAKALPLPFVIPTIHPCAEINRNSP
jgi:hypothetical protein